MLHRLCCWCCCPVEQHAGGSPAAELESHRRREKDGLLAVYGVDNLSEVRRAALGLCWRPGTACAWACATPSSHKKCGSLGAPQAQKLERVGATNPNAPPASPPAVVGQRAASQAWLARQVSRARAGATALITPLTQP